MEQLAAVSPHAPIPPLCSWKMKMSSYIWDRSAITAHTALPGAASRRIQSLTGVFIQTQHRAVSLEMKGAHTCSKDSAKHGSGLYAFL